MSSDYAVVVRGRKHSSRQLRAIVAAFAELAELANEPADDSDDGDDDADDDDGGYDASFAGIGTIQIRRLTRGYQLAVDSNRDGNRERFDDLCELIDALAPKLGSVVEGDAADELLDETDDGPPNARTALLVIEDTAGAALETARLSLDQLAQLLDPANHPANVRHYARPAMFGEDHRYALRGTRMIATAHDARGRPFRRYVWQLDAYGRIRDVDVSDV